MKRRAVLSAIGAGSIAAGTLLGTGSVSRIEAQRRVKLEVGPIRELAGISSVAFYGGVDVESVEILTVNEDGKAVEIEWETNDPVEEVILKGGYEWYWFDAEGATSGTAIMAEENGGVQICSDCPDRRERDEFEPCPGSSSKGETWTELEYDGNGEFGDPETTTEVCPGDSSSNTGPDEGEESGAEGEPDTEPDTDSDSEAESSDESDSEAESSDESDSEAESSDESDPSESGAED